MLQRLVNIAYPPRCVFCAQALNEGLLCARCDQLLPRMQTACVRCAIELPASSADGETCGACQRSPPPFDAARAVFRYSFPVDSALKSFKFRHQTHYGPLLVREMLAVVSQDFADNEALLPVPLYRWRQIRRGFNQAHELAKPLSLAIGRPLVLNVRRVRNTSSQAGLDAAARRRNLTDAFSVEGKLGYSRVLIVDDVMTTGATCRQLAATLKSAGAEHVDILVAARA